MFAGEVPIIGKADPMKAVTAPGKVVEVQPGKKESLDEALANIMASGSGYPQNITDSLVKKTSKGKKKA